MIFDLNRFIAPASSLPYRRRLGCLWIVILAFSPFTFNCLPVQQAWVAHYNNGSNTTNHAVAMALDKDGNIYIAGHSTRPNAPYDYDYVLIKYNPFGVQQWVSRYGFPGINDHVRAMVANTNGEVFITGTTETLKYLPNGSLVWNAPYAGRDIATDTNGNVYVTGFLTNDFSVLKIASSGTNLWLKTWDYRGAQDLSHVVAVDAFGNSYLAGLATYFCDRATCHWHLRVAKYDPGGSLLWNILIYEGEYRPASEFKGFACDAEGNLYIGMKLLRTFAGASPWATRKITTNGDYSWSKKLNDSNYDMGLMDMALDMHANAYYTGIEGGAYESYKLTAEGTNIWKARYLPNVLGPHEAHGITADAEGAAYVSGASTGVGTGKDYATIKYSTNGQELWVMRYTEPGNSDDQAVAIALSQSGDVYVTGFSNPTNGLYEITTIKYIQVAPIEKKSNGNVLLQFPGAPGSNYVIQASTNLPNWFTIGDATADSTGIYRFEDTNAPGCPSRFYKVLE